MTCPSSTPSPSIRTSYSLCRNAHPGEVDDSPMEGVEMLMEMEMREGGPHGVEVANIALDSGITQPLFR